MDAAAVGALLAERRAARGRRASPRAAESSARPPVVWSVANGVYRGAWKCPHAPMARRAFSEADALLGRLKAMGVEVFDKEWRWRGGADPAALSGPARAG